MKSESIRRKSKSNFGLAFFGLPAEQRQALSALYAYCRIVDDIVDETKDKKKASNELNRWRAVLTRIHKPSTFDPPVAKDLSIAVGNFPINVDDLLWIIDGVEMDLHQNRYQTFDELLTYCDGVASAVGFASMAIFGGDREQTAEYAFATGRALQLTNIIRDVGSDAQRDRVYLPLDDLKEFGYSERDLFLSVYNDAFRALMKFQAARAQRYYETSQSALPSHERKKYPAAELMRNTYEALLRKIEDQDFDVFPHKVRLPP